MLAGREQSVDAFVDANFRYRRSRQRRFDTGGFEAGERAAGDADLGNRRLVHASANED